MNLNNGGVFKVEGGVEIILPEKEGSEKELR